jgi:endoglucanase
VSGLTEVTFDGFVHAEDGRLVDGLGRPLLMRGVGLGNWLLPEGYMWRFPREGPQSAREIEALIADLVGVDAAAEFWRGFRERFIGEADVQQIAADGFDHVRLPLNARLLIDEAGDLHPEGLAPIDRLIAWCRRHGLWIILDLHAAPGGQTGTNIDDSPRGLPDLFLVGGAYRELTVELWRQLAARYRDETVVAAYDLLNEPLPHEYGERYAAELVSLYRDLTAAIRAEDPHHLLTYEGTRWSTDWGIFTEAWDPNSMLQFHKYWSAPDWPSIAGYVERARTLSLPVYMGEGGENDLAWLQTAFGLYEDLGISWNVWPWKKLDTWTSPLSVVPPEGWNAIVDYASGAGPRPRIEDARDTLDAYLDHLAVDACERREAVVNAVMRRSPIRLAPEAFGFRGRGASYWTSRGRPLDWFRSDDEVTLVAVDGVDQATAFDAVDRPGPGTRRFLALLGPDDWLEYTVSLAESTRLHVEVEVGALGDRPLGGLTLTVDGEPIAVDGERIAAETIAAGSVTADADAGRVRGSTTRRLASGHHSIRITATHPGTAIRSMSVAPRPSDEDDRSRQVSE